LEDVQLLGVGVELHRALDHLATGGQGVGGWLNLGPSGASPSQGDKGKGGAQGAAKSAAPTGAGCAVRRNAGAGGFALVAGGFGHCYQTPVDFRIDGFVLFCVHARLTPITFIELISYFSNSNSCQQKECTKELKKSSNTCPQSQGWLCGVQVQRPSRVMWDFLHDLRMHTLMAIACIPKEPLKLTYKNKKSNKDANLLLKSQLLTDCLVSESLVLCLVNRRPCMKKNCAAS
jgi:hypothetical protein